MSIMEPSLTNSMSPLFVPPEYSQTGDTYLSTQYTLRCCNRDYRVETENYNSTETVSQLPELDCMKAVGKISPLRTFDNPYGHWCEKITRVFNIAHHNSLYAMLSHLSDYINKTIDKLHIWDLDNTTVVHIDTILTVGIAEFSAEFIKVVQTQTENPYIPFSVHPAQAYVESLKKRGRDMIVYGLPGESTTLTGPHGGLHNNTSVEMGFEEPEGTRDMKKRTYDRKHIGFLCAGHTAHSADAGKSRRVCSYTRVRVLSRNTLDCLQDIDSISSVGEWVVYCMGSTTSTDLEGVCALVKSMNKASYTYYLSQFGSDRKYLPVPPTYAIYYKKRVLYISIAPGAVVRSIPGNNMIDSYMLHSQTVNPIVSHRKLPESGPMSIPYKYSPFFMLAIFAELNRPPRGLFASGQTGQAIFFPWSPATARVSPLHASKPLIATEFVRNIESDHETNADAIWDIFPGEDMTVCYMNLPLNYDDSMIISQRFVDNGGFSTISLCTYRIQDQHQVPSIGEKLCGHKYKWWKMPCTSTCVCKGYSQTSVSTNREPTARVKDIIRTEDGAISIKVLSFSQFLTGDKISMMHGQKGIGRVVPLINLPIIVMNDGSSFTADLYIAVGSIVSRQTNGQIFESGCAWRAARDGVPRAIADTSDISTEECSYLLKGLSGKIMQCQLETGEVRPIKATVGMTRVINQTQMTRERHHLTHSSEGMRSLGTTPGRANGGGVAAAEMDFHAMYSSGLYGCAQEIFNRGNACKIPICENCGGPYGLHDCNISNKMRKTILSFDEYCSDSISVCLNNSCSRYGIERL